MRARQNSRKTLAVNSQLDKIKDLDLALDEGRDKEFLKQRRRTQNQSEISIITILNNVVW